MLNFKREYFTLESERYLYPCEFDDKSKCTVYGRKKFITEAGKEELSAHVFEISKDFWTFNAGNLDFTNYPDGIWNDYISVDIVEREEYTNPALSFTSLGDITPENLQEFMEYFIKHVSDLEKRIVEDYLYIDEGVAENKELPNLPENHFWVRKNGVIVGVNLNYLKDDYIYLKSRLEKEFSELAKLYYDDFDALLKQIYNTYFSNFKTDLEELKDTLLDKTAGEILAEGLKQIESIIKEGEKQLEALIEIGSGYVPKFDNIEKLQKSFWLKEGQVVELFGYYEAGDGAGHKRIVKAEDDGSGVLLNNGLWANVIHNGEINVSWFGAKGDGVNDDTEVIQKAINKADVLYFDKNVYLISKTINQNSCLLINKDIIIYGNGGTIIQNYDIGSEEKHVFELDPNGNTIMFYNMIINGGVENAELFEWDIKHKGFRVKEPTDSTKRIKYLYFNNVTITNTKGESAYSADGTQECLFENCVFSHSGANMGNISGSTKYLNCKFVNGSALAIEHSTRAYGGYLIVENCEFNNSIKKGGNAIAVIHQYGDFNVENQEDFIKKLESRRNTRLEVRNCKFYNNLEYMENSTTSHELASTGVHVYGHEFVDISNNLFINYGSKMNYGAAIIRLDNYNENVNISSNNFIFYNEFLELSGGCGCLFINMNDNYKGSQIEKLFYTNNKMLVDFKNNESADINQRPTMFTSLTVPASKIKYSYFRQNQYHIFKNKLSTNNISLIGYGVNLPVTPINVKVKLNVNTAGNKIIYVADENHVRIDYLVNENLDIGEYEFNYSFYKTNDKGLLFQKINVRCGEGDENDDVEIIFSEVDNIPTIYNKNISQLDTMYMAAKMQQEEVYDDFITYMDEKTAYNKEQKESEKQKLEAYQEALKENPELTYEDFIESYPITVPLIEEPKPSKALKRFMEEYL